MIEEALLRAFEAGSRSCLGSAVERAAFEIVDHVGELEGLFHILVNDGPGIGIGVVDADLMFSQIVLEDLVFNAREAERPRLIEPQRLEIARDEFHCGNSARSYLADELFAT